MNTPLFGCRNEYCAPEVSYPAADLREHPEGGPICEYCWDNEPPVWLDGSDGEDAEDCLRWSDLPGFVPEHEQHIADLEAKLAAAERLISQVMQEHVDPESWTYNFCEDDPCQWCVEAQAAINRPGSKSGDSTEGAG